MPSGQAGRGPMTSTLAGRTLATATLRLASTVRGLKRAASDGSAAPAASEAPGAPGASVECGCCVGPQPNRVAATTKKAGALRKTLTGPNSYGSKRRIASNPCTALLPYLWASECFREKFAVRGCASSGAWMLDQPRARGLPPHARRASGFQARGFVGPEHQIQVLHGRPGGAFAQVI